MSFIISSESASLKFCYNVCTYLTKHFSGMFNCIKHFSIEIIKYRRHRLYAFFSVKRLLTRYKTNRQFRQSTVLFRYSLRHHLEKISLFPVNSIRSKMNNVIRALMKVLVFLICLSSKLQFSHAKKENNNNSELKLCESVKTFTEVPLKIILNDKLLSSLGWPRYKESTMKIVNQQIEFEYCM